MYCYVDESGNTGLELFDLDQPFLYYGLLTSPTDLDKSAQHALPEVRRRLNVTRLHANELGVGRLTTIAGRLTRFSRKNDLRFSLLKVSKQDHAIITFFDQVFDSGMNEAIGWTHYFTPLRYVLLLKVAFLFDDVLARQAWAARRERNPANCARMLTQLCRTLLERVSTLPDARSRELISGALTWAAERPTEISYGVGNYVFHPGTLHRPPPPATVHRKVCTS